jgi:uncharacterized protein
MSWLTGLLRWVRLALVIYGVILVLVTIFQRRLIYFPPRGAESEVIAQAAAAGLEPWRDGEGALVGFLRPARQVPAHQVPPPLPPAEVPVLIFHGNAGYAAHRGYLAQLFPHRPAYILEYPGFGARPGRPTEKSIRAAAEEAVLALTADGERVFLLGESIGSGPASWLAGRHPDLVAGVVLLTPFTRLSAVAKGQFPFLPVSLLLRDRWDNSTHLIDYPGPLAVLVASEDRLVPARFGQALHEGFPGRSVLWTVPGATHNTVMSELSLKMWREILYFVERSPGTGPAPNAGPAPGAE